MTGWWKVTFCVASLCLACSLCVLIGFLFFITNFKLLNIFRGYSSCCVTIERNFCIFILILNYASRWLEFKCFLVHVMCLCLLPLPKGRKPLFCSAFRPSASLWFSRLGYYNEIGHLWSSFSHLVKKGGKEELGKLMGRQHWCIWKDLVK